MMKDEMATWSDSSITGHEAEGPTGSPLSCGRVVEVTLRGLLALGSVALVILPNLGHLGLRDGT